MKVQRGPCSLATRQRCDATDPPRRALMTYMLSVCRAPIAGAIVGKALYEGRIDLRDALRRVKG